MSEPRSALSGAAFDGLCHVQEAGVQGMITLRADLSDAGVAQAVGDVLGLQMPDRRGIICAVDNCIAWMAPDEALILCPHDEVAGVLERLVAALGQAHALAVDVSDARASFTLRGAHVREVMAKLAPVDMSTDAFSPGMIRRTRLAQVAAAIWMPDAQTVRIVCFRSVAAYVLALLSNAAMPGSDVGIF